MDLHIMKCPKCYESGNIGLGKIEHKVLNGKRYVGVVCQKCGWSPIWCLDEEQTFSAGNKETSATI